jgi:dihydroorotase
VTDSDVKPYDSNYKMKPPLRSHCDVAAIVEGLVDGSIDVLATDHAPHPGSEKMQEFEKCPFGIIGLETAIGLTLEKLVHTGKISLMRMVELYTTGPANVLGLDRGKLFQGGPADVTIIHPSHEWTYDVNRSHSRSRNSPFDGHHFRGGPIGTIVNGTFVWRHDREASRE